MHNSERPSVGRGFRLLSLFVVLWMLISVACNAPTIPGVWQPSAEPTSQPTAQTPAAAASTATARPQPTPSVPLPPALVEATPLPESEIGLRQPLILYFNQAMDKPSVEGALASQPAVPGTFKWLNDSTLTITPNQPLPKDTDFSVSVSTNAKAANGLALGGPVTLAFHTAAGIQAVERLPLPDATDVDPASAVVVTFDHPVVPLGADPAKQPAAFTLDPATPGKSEWLNTSTFIFYANPGLASGASYSVKMNRDLLTPDGTGWASDDLPDWTFTTASPKIVDYLPKNQGSLYLDEDFSVEFNQAMNQESVANNFSLKGPQGNVAGKLTWNAAGTSVTFKPDDLLQRGAEYTLGVTTNAASLGGMPLGSGLNVRYVAVAGLGVFATQPAAGQTLQLNNGRGSVTISLTSPVTYSGSLVKMFSFDPPVTDFSVSVSGTGLQIYIYATLDGRKDYTLNISQELTDKWGSALKAPYQLMFKTGAAAATLTFNLAQSWDGIAFLTPQDSFLPLQATNIKTLTIGYAGITLNDFGKAINIAAYERYAKFQGPKQSFYTRTFSLPADRNVDANLPVSPGNQGLAPGLYYYVINAPDVQKSAAITPLLLVVSKTNLALKLSATQLMAWAVDLDSNTPLAGAAITVYENVKGELNSLGTIQTSDQGTGTLELSERVASGNALIAVIGKPGDANFSLAMTDWNAGLNAWDFGISTNYSDATRQVYLYTDRPIYRPGQTVNFRAVLRQVNNGRYTLTDITHLDLTALGAYNPQTDQSDTIAKIPLDLSDYGSGAGSFQLAPDAPPGYYTLQVDGFTNSMLGFQVAEYRKPEVELNASFNPAEILAGKDLSASVTAKYYFGAPAGNLNLRWNLYSQTDYFPMPGGYQTGTFNTAQFMPAWYFIGGSLGNFVAGGSAATAADGSLQITIPAQTLKDELDEQDMQTLTLEVTIDAQGEFPVSVRSQAVIHPAEFYIGIHPESWSGQAKTQLGFSIQTDDWLKQASPNHALEGVFKKVIWRQNPDWTPNTNQLYYTIEYQDAGKTDFVTDAQGRARLAFTPDTSGTYMLDVSGEGARTQVLVWVSGEGSAPWPVTPNQAIEITADAASYQPGQTASLFIPNPFGADALALITVERGKVMRSFVVNVKGSSLTYALPLGEEDAPNVYASVILLGKTDSGAPDYRVGYLNLKVDPAALKLQVSLVSQPEKPAPGGNVNFTLQVKDSKGKPVQGEFSLALVDKAVLALADPNSLDIFNEYYANQPLGVVNSLALSISGQRMVLAQPGRGGGGGMMEVPPSTRQKFEDTAFWNGKIVTDANGQAQVSASLPDNLTTWVLTLRGLTRDTLVGEAVQEVVVTKDLLIRPFTPSFLVVGDHIQLSATIQNNTPRDLAVDAGLQASGVDLDDASQATQKVNVAANGRKSVSWWVKVQDTDKADLVFSARSGDLSDTTRTDPNSLPVSQFSSPQTYSTSGILAQAGEKLEVISIPRSFTPTGGEFRLEMAPSLAAAVLEGLKAMDTFDQDFTETALSRLLPNVETYRTLQVLKLDAPNLNDQLKKAIQTGMDQVNGHQNKDGGWGWRADEKSDPLVSTYALYTLARAGKASIFVDAGVLKKAQDYVSSILIKADANTETWQLDRLAYQVYTLQVSGRTVSDAGGLYPLRERLSNWARAMLAMTLDEQKPGDERAKTMLSDLASKAERSSTGASWESGDAGEPNNATTNFTTAVVLLALDRLNATSSLVTDAVRQLVAHRNARGCWGSSYESAWVLLSLTETLKISGDLQSSFTFSAALNGTPLSNGQAGGPNSLTTVEARVPLRDLRPDQPNDLKLVHDAGNGNLYYRAFLQVNQPVESAQPLQRGITISREYGLPGQDCRKGDCPAINSIALAGGSPTLLVRLTITLPHQMYYVVVDDYIPAGSEIVNLALNTSQVGDPTLGGPLPVIDPSQPFANGWNWWWFGQPQVFTDHIRWVATSLAAGTYQVTYRITALQAGEYRVLPAHAYQLYFPDVGGTSAGSIFKITQ